MQSQMQSQLATICRYGSSSSQSVLCPDGASAFYGATEARSREVGFAPPNAAGTGLEGMMFSILFLKISDTSELHVKRIDDIDFFQLSANLFGHLRASFYIRKNLLLTPGFNTALGTHQEGRGYQSQ
jgi:hypothetical protein